MDPTKIWEEIGFEVAQQCEHIRQYRAWVPTEMALNPAVIDFIEQAILPIRSSLFGSWHLKIVPDIRVGKGHAILGTDSFGRNHVIKLPIDDEDIPEHIDVMKEIQDL